MIINEEKDDDSEEYYNEQDMHSCSGRNTDTAGGDSEHLGTPAHVLLTSLINEEKDDDSERALRSASACLARQPFFVPVATAGISIAARERMLRLV